MMSEPVTTSTSANESSPQTDSHVWQFAQDVAGALVNPSETLREVGRREAIIPAMMLVLLIALISAAGQATVLILSLAQVPGFDTRFSGQGTAFIAGLELTGLVWNFIWAPVLWTILAGILYGVVYLMGGRGRFSALWAATGFALAPQLLAAPFTSMTELLTVLGTGWQLLSWLVVAPVTILSILWTVGLFVIAIRETMSVSTGRAIGSIAALVGALLLVGFLLLCAFFLIIAAIIGIAAA